MSQIHAVVTCESFRSHLGAKIYFSSTLADSRSWLCVGSEQDMLQGSQEVIELLLTSYRTYKLDRSLAGSVERA